MTPHFKRDLANMVRSERLDILREVLVGALAQEAGAAAFQKQLSTTAVASALTDAGMTMPAINLAVGYMIDGAHRDMTESRRNKMAVRAALTDDDLLAMLASF